VLLTSELATNAVVHGSQRPGTEPGFLLSVMYAEKEVLLAVRDGGSSTIPCLREVGPDEINGRGLALVDGLAKQWGFHRDSAGTLVWVELASRDSVAAGI
jgi:anti-sigma regulatory factor (Ser/Thr protein kinase)